MLKVLSRQLGLPATAVATLQSLYADDAASERALRMHRAWARETLGFSSYNASAEADPVKVVGSESDLRYWG